MHYHVLFFYTVNPHFNYWYTTLQRVVFVSLRFSRCVTSLCTGLFQDRSMIVKHHLISWENSNGKKSARPYAFLLWQGLFMWGKGLKGGGSSLLHMLRCWSAMNQISRLTTTVDTCNFVLRACKCHTCPGILPAEGYPNTSTVARCSWQPVWMKNMYHLPSPVTGGKVSVGKPQLHVVLVNSHPHVMFCFLAFSFPVLFSPHVTPKMPDFDCSLLLPSFPTYLSLTKQSQNFHLRVHSNWIRMERIDDYSGNSSLCVFMCVSVCVSISKTWSPKIGMNIRNIYMYIWSRVYILYINIIFSVIM